MLTIAKFDRFDIVNNIGEDKPSFTIWFSGCTIRCNECHNKQLWDKSSGNEMAVDNVVDIIVRECHKLNTDTVVLLGGEPLDQELRDLYQLCADIHLHDIRIWLYTGYNYDEIPVVIKECVDVIKCGRYIDELKCDGFPSSTNQELWERIDGNWVKV